MRRGCGRYEAGCRIPSGSTRGIVMEDKRAGTPSGFSGDRSPAGLLHAGSNRVLSVSAWLLIIEQAMLLAFILLHGVGAPGPTAGPTLGAWALWVLSLGTLAFASFVLFRTSARAERGGPTGAAPLPPASWEAANRRRIYLIDKDLDGSITGSEKVELDDLERSTGRFIDIVAPLPTAVLDDLRRAIREAEGRIQVDGQKGSGG